MPAKQTIVITRVKTTKKTRTKKQSSKKKGNPNRCPSYGRFM